MKRVSILSDNKDREVDLKRVRVISRQEVMRALMESAEDLKRLRVKRIGVFGSFARGEQKQRSDIDLLVEFDKSAFDRNLTGYSDNYDRLLRELERILRRRIDLVTQDMLSPFIRPYVEKDIEYLETA